ncbi:MAG: hypothetical protein KDJ66_08540 [Nitratireductor sp.]|nr:hypothetical protein [Nitratireductor sp.]
MVNNIDRAEWAGEALQCFADITMDGYVGDEAICDLICDIGHFAEIELGYSKDKVLQLFATAIGAWSAESDCSLDEPDNNDSVEIVINQR